MQHIELTGQRFARLQVERFGGYNKWRNALWECRCDCGRIVTVASGKLRDGHTQSCGCLKPIMTAARNHKHGLSNSGPEYKAWKTMKARCYSPKNGKYYRYGARGIIVCDRWRDSFELFLEDMGRRPSPKHSLGRRDNDGNYDPANCRWETAVQQANNTSQCNWYKQGLPRPAILDEVTHAV